MLNAAEDFNRSLKKYFALAVLSVLFALFALIVGGAGVLEFTGVDLGIVYPDHDPTAITINWKQEYPFDDKNYEETEAKKWRNSSSQLAKAFKRYIELMNQLATFGDTNKTHIYYYQDVASFGFACELYLADPTIGGYPGVGGACVRLSNGMWTWARYKWTDEYVAGATDGIVSLNNFLKKKGIPFLYVHALDKNCRLDPKMPPSIVDYLHDNQDRVMRTLQEQGVITLDLREELHKDFDDHYAFFYKTDHHWGMKAGLWVADLLERRLDELFGVKCYRGKNDESNYRVEVYEKALFGSLGHSVMNDLAEPEDFQILYPKFKTCFGVVIPDKEIDTKGSFEDVLIDKQRLDQENARLGGSGYLEGCLLGGNRPMVKIKNYLLEDGPRILLVKDSTSLPVAPYLAVGCSELDSIDVRPESGNFDGSLRTYILKMKPDVVVMINYPHVLDYK